MDLRHAETWQVLTDSASYRMRGDPSPPAPAPGEPGGLGGIGGPGRAGGVGGIWGPGGAVPPETYWDFNQNDRYGALKRLLSSTMMAGNTKLAIFFSSPPLCVHSLQYIS
jgi:hypothetical protein